MNGLSNVLIKRYISISLGVFLRDCFCKSLVEFVISLVRSFPADYLLQTTLVTRFETGLGQYWSNNKKNSPQDILSVEVCC